MKKPCPKCQGIVSADARVFDTIMANHIRTCPTPPPRVEKEVKKR